MKAHFYEVYSVQNVSGLVFQTNELLNCRFQNWITFKVLSLGMPHTLLQSFILMLEALPKDLIGNGEQLNRRVMHDILL